VVLSDVVTVRASPLVAASSRLLVSAAWVPAVPWTTAPTLKAVAVNVPAVTAVAMAVFKSPIVLVPAAFAVKLNWSPLVPSLMVVTEFAASVEVRASGVAVLPAVVSKAVPVLPANTFCPLKLVVWPTWLISFRIDWNSVSSAVA